MSISRFIYDHSPVFLQNLAVTISGKGKASRRYGSEYAQFRAFLKECDSWSREELLAYQQRELNAFLSFVRTNSRYYQDLYAGIDLPDPFTVDDLRLLPIVTKEMLRENIEHIVTIDRRAASIGHTGGTTGKSLTVYNRPMDGQRRMAILDHFKSRHGFENGQMRKATFNGKYIIPVGNKTPVFWRHNAAIKQRIYSSFHLTEKNLPLYVADMNEFRPAAIDGFFSSIYEIASFILRHGVDLKFTPIAIFPTSETVTPRERLIIEQAFRCPVRDQYASSEGAPFITECTHGRLHYETISGVFEECNLPGAEPHETLVTSFSTYGTPLIRYRIGDVVELADSSESCGCGLHTPLVKRIGGRRADFLYSDNGAKVNSGQIANIFKSCPNSVVRAQIVQNEVGRVEIRVIPDRRLFGTSDQDSIRAAARQTLGRGTAITIVLTDEIERARSGKHRLIVNNVSKHWTASAK